MRRILIGLVSLLFSTSLFASYPESDYFTTNAISNEYIVVLKPEVSTQSFSLRASERVLKRFSNLNGMLVETSDDPSTLKREGVAYVEPNSRVHILTDQPNATWGIDRIDSRSGLDGIYKYSATGSGVNVYIIDTGVFANHNEFSGRMRTGYSAIADGSTNDCNGHGTHVAGTAAGTTFGVAKQANIYPVRVLDCEGSGSNADVIEGIEWVANNARRPAVANMSLGGSRSQAVNDVVSKAIAKGVVFVVAAGNSSDNSCNYSPASTPEAITVAASDKNDTSATFTSYGSCVDTYASGVSITSAGISSPSSTATMSGTSMASPHTAGAVALLLEKSPNSTPAAIAAQLLNNATRGPIRSVPASTPNLLIFTNPQGGGGTDPTPTPTPEPPSGNKPTECNDSWACFVNSGNLSPNTYYEQLPKEPMVVNYARPLKIYTQGNADFDIYLYYSNNGGQSWTEVARATAVGSSEAMTYQANNRGIYVFIVMLKTSGTSGTHNTWIVK